MISSLDYFRELNFPSVLLRLLLAMVFGGMIGLERVEIVRVLQKEDTKQHTLNSVAEVVKGRNVCVDTSS
mgnify:CR=1 FL=1